MRPAITGIVDISNAYIIDCDFESGIFERSNWNSGYHFNFNNDVNITSVTSSGKYYNLSIFTSSATILATTSQYSLPWTQRDTKLGDLDAGEIIFLNSVYYNTSGRVDKLQVVTGASGSNYQVTSNGISTLNGSGFGLIVDYTATATSSVYLTNPIIGGMLTPGGIGYTTLTNVSTTAIFPSIGYGLTLDIIATSGTVSSVTVNNPGFGYNINDTVQVNGGNPTNLAIITISDIYNGEVISVTASYGGINYQIGDIITINDGDINAQLEVTSVTGSITRLPDAYKIINNNNGALLLKEINTSTQSIFFDLLEGGEFYTKGVENRWGYLNKSKITKSKIRKGFFKRTYLFENLIQNFDLDLTDKDFVNLNQFQDLLLSDIIFADNFNILSKATYMNSSFRLGSDIWDNGVFYNSSWCSGTFSKGLFKESNWNDGVFQSGTFYQSRSFNANPTSSSTNYDTNRVWSYFKAGKTSATESNNRWSWQKGTFKSGEFLKSDWEKGNFEGGKFSNSKWYSGTLKNGTIGDIGLSSDDTKFYSGVVENAIVENAKFYAEDSSLSGLSQSTITWLNGTFNLGIFGSKIDGSQHSATWVDGVFNGGEFITNAKWLNGTFNGGKFISGFGWTFSEQINTISTLQSEYTWQDGVFNGGEFGNASTGTNSTWWTGEFNGGKFIGRIWKDGIFTDGRFIGSATFSAVGGYEIDGMTESNASMFVDSFTNSFYGLWNDGFVTPDKDDYIKTKKLFTPLLRNVQIIKPQINVTFENMLWNSGTFSHTSGKITNSVWLSGEFRRGRFEKSSFNPWVRRNLSTSQSFDVNDDLISVSGSCIWRNGILDNSDFYISQWVNGKFIYGTAIGAIWKNGVTNYMNAYNVFWEDGTWKNGNWNGSHIDFDQSIDSEFNRQVLYRGMQWSGTSSCHIWNVFLGAGLTSSLISSTTASNDLISNRPEIINAPVIRGSGSR